MRLVRYILLGLLISGSIFVGFHKGFTQVVAASTGYNATGHGLFGWDRSFVEHEFTSDGDAYRGVVIDSGHKVGYPSLIAEILVSCVLGFGALMVLLRLRLLTTDEDVEKDDPSIGGKRSCLHSGFPFRLR